MRLGAYLTGAVGAAVASIFISTPADAGDGLNGWIPPASQAWTSGWDNFGEPLNYTSSKVVWQLKSGKLTVTYSLVGANPSKLYQVGLTFFCDQGKVPKTVFGRFPVDGPCTTITRQGVTASQTAIEFGAVLTDVKGNGSVKIAVGSLTSGTYAVEFGARDGAGCNVAGGAGNGSDCAYDFQSPGPTFGDTTSIVVP